MADQGHADLGARYLTMLRGELSGRGVRCELIDYGIVPRLRFYEPGDTGGAADFDNNIVAVPLGGGWFYCWPWAEPIGPVTRPRQAAQAILTDLGLDGPASDRSRRPVADGPADAGTSPAQHPSGARAEGSTRAPGPRPAGTIRRAPASWPSGQQRTRPAATYVVWAPWSRQPEPGHARAPVMPAAASHPAPRLPMAARAARSPLPGFPGCTPRRAGTRAARPGRLRVYPPFQVPPGTWASAR